MSNQLRIEKLLEEPEFITPDTLYLYKDDYDRLVVAQADRDGILAFSTVNTADVHAIVDAKLSSAPIINGPRTIALNQTQSYIITNYDVNTTYNLVAISGSVFRNDDTITYTAPSTGVSCGFIINSTQAILTISNPSMVVTPQFTDPIDNEEEIAEDYELHSTAFATAGDSDTHVSSDWQVSTTVDFSSLLLFTNNNTNKLVNWPTSLLPVNMELFARVRHKGLVLGLSDWSPIISFKTKKTYVNAPSFTNLVNDQISIPQDYEFISSAFSKRAGDGTHESSDWQIATDINFANIVKSSIDSVDNKTSWLATDLSVSTAYYIRVRHKASTGSYSAWSEATRFVTRTTFDTAPNNPIINVSLQGAIDIAPSLTITSSQLDVTTGTETHQYSEWQLATDIDFTEIIDSTVDDAFNKTSWLVQNLEANTTLYVRVRYKGLITNYSAWSTVVSFNTKQSFDTKPNTPNITSPVLNSEDSLANEEFTSTPFAVTTGTDTHLDSTWELATDGAFTQIVAQVVNSAANKTSWTPGDLNADTEYFVRVRYTGDYTGISDWSPVIAFKTKNTYDTQPAKPVITSPVNNSTDLGPDVSVISSAFHVNTGSEVHESSHWQVATDDAFTTIIMDNTDETTYKTNINLQSLPVDTNIYIRVRYLGATLGLSAWSDTVMITTKQSYSETPNTPSITSPTNNSTDSVADEEFTASAFAVGSGEDTHLNSDWQIATDINFTNIIQSTSNDIVNLTSWTPGGLPVNTMLYARVRYKGSYTGASEWSSIIIFTTKNTYDLVPVTPDVTSPENNDTDLGPDVEFNTRALFVETGEEVHESSDWQLATDAAFTNIIDQVTNSTVNKNTWTATSVPVATTLYVRVRHKGDTLGYSAWSDAVVFSTKQSFSTAPNTPSITSPLNNAVDVTAEAGLTSNAFAVNSGTDTHASSSWEIATDAEFTNIIKSVNASITDKTTWTPGNLPVDTTLFARVRYTGDYTGISNWSNIITFSTKQTYLPAPEVTYPLNAASDIAGSVSITTDAFTSEFTGDVHDSSDWQLSTDSGFVTIIESSLNDNVNKISWTVSDLPENTTYYVRTRRHSSDGGTSEWSDTISFSTLTAYITAPTITAPTNGSNNHSPYVNITSNAFNSEIGGQTHASTDWQIATDAGFSNIVAESNADATNKTSWTYTPGLASNTTYYVRIRYRAASGLVSAWSSTVIFTTKTYYVATPSITSPVSGATNLGPVVTVTTGAFSSEVTGETHVSTDWQLSKFSDFSVIAAESIDDTVNKTSWNTPSLDASTVYYLRARYKGSSSL